MHSLKSLFRQLHAALPDNVRYPIDVASISIQDTLRNWHMPAYRVQAPLPEGQGEGTVLYLGNRPQYKSWTNKLFGRSIEPSFIGKFSLAQVLRRNNPALCADLTLCPINPWTLSLFTLTGWHIIPLYVLSKIDLAKPLDTLTSNSDAKNELRKLRKLNYYFRELRDEEAFKEFYHEMLKPTVMQRHSENPFLSSFESLKQLYNIKGFLLAAYLDSEWVGANLVYSDKDTLVCANVGWREASDVFMKKRIVSALQHELIKRAAEQGFHTLDLGSSNPFANDGPLNYKLKWGADIKLPELLYAHKQIQGSRAFIAARFNLASGSAQSMLHNTPLFERHKNSLRVIGWNSIIPPALQRQIDSGIEWINLANTSIID